MSASAIFVGPNGANPTASIRATVQALSTVTQGDLLHVGQRYRSIIRQRTAQGIDVNGALFAPYSTKGPIYFTPSPASGTGAAARAARATAAKNRHKKTGGLGVRTPYGIRYESYAAMKSALGRSGVDLYGAKQHPHMLDAIIVKAGGVEVGGGIDLPNFGSEFEASEGIAPAHELTLGFYGPEAERARGNNEGTRKVPKRFFFGLNAGDIAVGEQALVQRMEARARQHG